MISPQSKSPRWGCKNSKSTSMENLERAETPVSVFENGIVSATII